LVEQVAWAVERVALAVESDEVFLEWLASFAGLLELFAVAL
jgi:hypothetical protein